MDCRFKRGVSGNVFGPEVFQRDDPIQKPGWRMVTANPAQSSEPVMILTIR